MAAGSRGGAGKAWKGLEWLREGGKELKWAERRWLEKIGKEKGGRGWNGRREDGWRRREGVGMGVEKMVGVAREGEKRERVEMDRNDGWSS